MKTRLSLLILILITTISFAQDTPSKKWTLQECVDYALENNIQVKQNELSVDLAEVNKKMRLVILFPV